MRQIILDTETTGLNFAEGHRIIEIGCVELINRKLTGNRFHQYINPQREVEQGALEVHGITNAFLESKPLFADIAHDFMEFIKSAELIIHNAPFDVGFINYELGLLKQKWLPLADYCRITDTLALARQLHVGQRNSLDALCKRYSVDNTHREYHGALLDAHLLAQVYLAMTGGQGSLFDELQVVAESVTAKQQQEKVMLQPRALTVLLASAEELAEHEDKLQKMASKGQCLWLQEKFVVCRAD